MKLAKFKLLWVLIIVCTCAKSQPFTYKGSKMLNITFQSSQEVIDKLVPEPLVANSQGLMVINIGTQRIAPGYTYSELILSIPVTYNKMNGSYCFLLYLDEVPPIIAGREIWGFPKYYADFEIEINDRNADAKVLSEGNLLIEAELEFGNSKMIENSQDPLLFVVKNIPSIEKGRIDVKQLNSLYMSNYTVTKLIEAEAKLSINEISNASIGQIPVIRILNASYTETDFILDYGKIEYDYLKDEGL